MLSRKPAQYVSLDLPTPVSANRLWRSVKTAQGVKVYKSKEYLSWLSEAGYRLNAQRPGIVEGPYALTITIRSTCRLDLDNCCKATSDLLQSQGVIQNDRLCQQLLVKKGDIPGMSVLVASTRDVKV